MQKGGRTTGSHTEECYIATLQKTVAEESKEKQKKRRTHNMEQACD